MMELLPLPNFYHLPMALTLLLLALTLLVLIKKRKKHPSINYDDPYALTKALRKKRATQEIRALLKELENYKYTPNPPKLPKALKKRIKKVLQ
jgi:hypothetical protein